MSSIAIVSSLVHVAQAAPTDASAEGSASGTALVADGRGGLDFASILLGLPSTAAAPARGGEARSSEAATSDDPAALAVPQWQTILALPLSANPGMPAGAAETGLLSPTLASRSALLPAAAPSTLASTPQELRTQAGDERWSAAAPAAISDGKAAKFAVADFAAQAFGQNEIKRPEQLRAPASNLATLAPASQSPHAAAGIAQEHSLSLPTPLRDPAWASDFGQKLLWFAGSDRQLAQLTLNPPQLGAVEITLKIDKETANAHFFSANADVRGTIEAALPRLREMFASAGINLGQVSVGSESFRQQPDNQGQPSGSPRPLADTAILASDSASGLGAQGLGTHRGSRLVDIFA